VAHVEQWTAAALDQHLNIAQSVNATDDRPRFLRAFWRFARGSQVAIFD
jgi:hypothetical protein